jgi:thymidine kinase
MDYGSLPSLRDITLDEICFFYDPLIDNLTELQNAKKKTGKQ